MTDLERSAFAECEAVIARGVQTFYEVGTALLTIRDQRLYRADYGTFEDYCQERWGWSRSYVHRQIEAAQVIDNLLPIGNIPRNEAQARELARVAPEQQRKVWTAAVAQSSNSQPTARAIAEVLIALEQAEREKPPSPTDARRLAIETGKAVLDSEGWYQPPVSIEIQEALENTLDLFDLIIGLPESDLLKHAPADLLQQFAGLRQIEKSKLRRVSLDRYIAWLVEFEHERKNRCE